MSVALVIGRRLLAIAVIMIVVSFLVFAILFATPGSPEQLLLGAGPTTPEALAAVRAKYHLDEPLFTQYLYWLGDAVRLDFGESIQTSQPVVSVLGERLPITLFLAGYATVIALLVGIPSGLLAGLRNGTAGDRLVTFVTTLGISAPSFAIGILLLYVFGITLGWFPIFGAGEGFADRLLHLTLPAVALSATVLAIIARQTRAAALTVESQDYMTFARARGLPRRLLFGRYALRNSSLPVVTSSGLVLASFLTGAVLVEQVFAIPGLGSLTVAAVTNKDVPVVQAVALLAALVVLVLNLLADLAYTVLDPRVRKVVFPQ
ncbi:ABC transporter permease [Prauserella cavernicola]|uniref:ABC transporter permease n=1 Tax=Prauserella cavernicola TaxID=2800127 RepID=A0A934QS81_9PSEU|nr:ABC transporter permease [Prauserella cavernicola]MBK1787282.1 ABC transporter permease [Prauserella cavernicola]